MSSPRWAAPTWRAEVSAAATSRSGRSSGTCRSLASRPRPAEAAASGRAHRPARRRRRRSSSRRPSSSAQHDRGGGGVEHELVECDGGDLAGGDPGEQRRPLVARRRAAAGRRWRSRSPAAGTGRGCGPSSSSTTAVSTSEAPKPSYSSGTASAATPTCSHSACHSASSYPLSDSHRRAHGGAVAALVEQRARRSRRARPAPRCGRSASAAPQGVPRRSARGGTTAPPHAPTRARTRLIHRPRSNSAV